MRRSTDLLKANVTLVLSDVARAAGARCARKSASPTCSRARPIPSPIPNSSRWNNGSTRCKNCANGFSAKISAPLNFGELARHQALPAEHALLEKVEDSLAQLQTLSPADLKLVRNVLTTITSGQELDLRRFAKASAEKIIALETEAELDDYTYRVAGCVGGFWTKICRAHLFPKCETGR